jgi:hypothetical protein
VKDVNTTALLKVLYENDKEMPIQSLPDKIKSLLNGVTIEEAF